MKTKERKLDELRLATRDAVHLIRIADDELPLVGRNRIESYAYDLLHELLDHALSYLNATLDEAETKLIKKVCAWCPDAQERTQRLRDEEFIVSHGICDSCLERITKGDV